MSTRALSKMRMGAMALIALAAVLVVAGCGGSSSSSNGDSTAAVKAGGVLHLTLIADPPSLNPSVGAEGPAIEVNAQINEPLFKLEESGKISPLLATSYKRSADNLTWTIDLRKGVSFSDGKPFAAKDAVFTLEAERKSPYFGGLFEEVESVKELSPSSIQIKTKKPMAALLADLTAPSSGVVPDNYGGVSEKEFAQSPVGTGPFMLKQWAHGQSITLAKNPRYWQPKTPLADEVVFTPVQSSSSRVAQFRGGDLDLVESQLWSQLKSLEQTPGINVNNYGMYRYDYLGLNLSKPLFANTHVREAVNLAIDRDGIVKAALGGYGEAAASYLPPTLPFHTDLPVQAQDLAKAKQLLDEAKAEGVDASFTISTFAGEAYAEAAGQIIQQDLNEAGFKVTLQPLDLSTLYEKYLGGETDATLAGYYAGVPDPSELTSFYLGVVAKPNGSETKPLEALASQASAELDSAKRQALYTQLQEGIEAELQAVPLDYQPLIWLTQDNVGGLEVNPVNTIWLNKTGFTE